MKAVNRKVVNRKVFAAFIILGVLFAGGVSAYELFHPAPRSTAAVSPSVLVTELNLTPGTMNETFTAYGSIQPGTGGESALTPQANGILAGVAVTAGQHVAAGQELATLHADAASIADAQRAVSAVAAAKANVAHVSALLVSHLATNADLAASRQVAGDAQAALAAILATGAGRTRALTAPFAGIVTAVLATPGTAFAAGTPLLRIANAAGLIASIGLPPAQASQVVTGDVAKLTFLDTGSFVPGAVAGIGAVQDPQTGLLPLQVVFRAQQGLGLGQPVEADITAQRLAGYVVPRDAVQTDDAGDFVYQVDARNIAHRTKVQIKAKAGAQTLIAAGIDADLPVVVTGAPQLADGMAVRTTP